ncbi:hypothetical protein [Mycobacterium sp. D16R24]|uniref:hypothetical protein n=1 Tax=Mycobacterium sp. D16R24 TaxID=1855656 RepID=UPI0009919B04|nr:hypothetical protein [Mycobacterium sp. D16R24]
MKRIQWSAAIVGAAATGLLAAASGQSCIAWADQDESAGVITSSATVYEALPPGHPTAISEGTPVTVLCLTGWDGPNDGRPASSSSDSPFGAYLKVNYAQGSGYIRSDKVAIRRGAGDDGLRSCPGRD